MGSDSTAQERESAAAVDRLLQRHDWRLVGRDEFVRRTVEHARSGIATDPQRAAVGVYCLALYRACSGEEGPARKELAYTELHRYLFEAARQRYPEIADDVTQSALERTVAAFGRCRQPVAFLAFAFQHLLDAARTQRRQERYAPRSLDPEDDSAPQLADEQADLGAHVLDDERRSALKRSAEAFLSEHPRASQQLAALWLKHIDGLDDRSIGDQLGVTVDHVYVLRSRVARKLRTDPRWRSLAVEFGILPDEV
ncbi:MAG TPA: sigma-70 family RNA polymerase sigma factor [Roseiflexaceae bacterium]|nr:sigma-70 family RNA polymerase sigma factor [Roseiflexaceae bacterium]